MYILFVDTMYDCLCVGLLHAYIMIQSDSVC